MKKPRFSAADFFTNCRSCGASFDMRDLEQVEKHLHGTTYKAVRAEKSVAKEKRERSRAAGMASRD
jgi:hypothetical protein